MSKVTSKVDYEAIWQVVWGDMQKYGPVHRHHRRIFGQLIATLPPAEIQTIADIGCGEGSNLLYLHHVLPHAELFGFDISQAAIDKANRILPAHYTILDIEREMPQQKFDFVICSDVIEHIEDDLAALRHIYQATNRYALIATVQGRMRKFEKFIGHVRSYHDGEFRQKLQAVGFKVVKIVEWGFPLYSPLYRDLFNYTSIEKRSHGKYGVIKRIGCHILYGLFFFNRSNRGDIVFALVKP
jgi:trans-aconitate methyltransferase